MSCSWSRSGLVRLTDADAYFGMILRDTVNRRCPWGMGWMAGPCAGSGVSRSVHYPTEKPLVEPGQLYDVSTVQHHTLQIGDHEGQRLTTPDHDLQRRRRQNQARLSHYKQRGYAFA